MSDLVSFLNHEPRPFITPMSRVKLHSFFYRQEGEEYVVGCPSKTVYMSMPSIGVEAMRLLDQGMPIGVVAYQLRGEDGELPDMVDFIQTLLAYDLIAEIDGHPISEAHQNEETTTRKQFKRFAWLQTERVTWLFSKPALMIHGAVAIGCGFLLWLYPQYIPQSQDFFVHPWYTLNTLIVLVTGWFFILLHELGHLAAARAHHIDGHLSIGRRLYSLVAQCELEHLYKINLPDRLVVYLAGMIVNVWIFFLALVVLIWQRQALPPLLNSWLMLVLVLQWYSIAWQFRFYMQTDIYFIVSDIFYARNLMDEAKAFLYSLGQRLRGHQVSHDVNVLPRRERRFVKVYACFYLFGIGIALVLGAIYVLPFLLGTIGGAISVVSQGPSVGTTPFIDAIVVLILYSVYFGLLAWVLARERFRQRLPFLSRSHRASKQSNAVGQ